MEHKIDCVTTVIPRSVSDEAISKMSFTLRLRRLLQSLAMTIGDAITFKLFLALNSDELVESHHLDGTVKSSKCKACES